MEQLREELLANDPVEMRRRANAVLGQILAKRLDPRYRRTALDVLKHLDEQERAAAAADRETYRMAVAQLAALDAVEGGPTKLACATSDRPTEQERQRIDAIIDEIDRLVAEQLPGRDIETSPAPVLDSSPDDPPQIAEEAIPGQAELPGSQSAAPPASGVRLVRKPGHFGKGRWMRQPNS
jgi:hypothetical protein